MPGKFYFHILLSNSENGVNDWNSNEICWIELRNGKMHWTQLVIDTLLWKSMKCTLIYFMGYSCHFYFLYFNFITWNLVEIEMTESESWSFCFPFSSNKTANVFNFVALHCSGKCEKSQWVEWMSCESIFIVFNQIMKTELWNQLRKWTKSNIRSKINFINWMRLNCGSSHHQ